MATDLLREVGRPVLRRREWVRFDERLDRRQDTQEVGINEDRQCFRANAIVFIRAEFRLCAMI